MHWNPSDVVTLTAIIGTAVTPIATAIVNWNKSKLQNDNELKKAKLELQQTNFEDFKCHYRTIFERYIQSTHDELVNRSDTGFSDEHQALEARVLLYADDNLFNAITSLDDRKAGIIGAGFSNFKDEYYQVIKAFNSQWQTLMPSQS